MKDIISLPGKKNEVFKLRFDNHHFCKGEIIACAPDSSIRGNLVKVIKVYKYTWWKKLLSYLGIKTKWLLFTGVKVKIIK